MLQPKRTKFRKQQKGRMKGNAQRGTTLSNGTFGIKSLDANFITARQIEAARIGGNTLHEKRRFFMDHDLSRQTYYKETS